jgi:hypothetical protein
MARKKAGGSDGDKPKRRDVRSVLGWSEIARIQVFVTGAAGVARMPKSEPGSRSGSGYAQSLLNTTPRQPELKVVALKRDETETTVSVVISTPNGAVNNEFTTKRVLTTDNAQATAASIAKVLKDPTAVGMCTRALNELLGEPTGSMRAFSLKAGNRIMIESGEG